MKDSIKSSQADLKMADSEDENRGFFHANSRRTCQLGGQGGKEMNEEVEPKSYRKES